MQNQSVKKIVLIIVIIFALFSNNAMWAQATPGPSYPGLVITQLGQVSNVPLNYGGLAFKYNDDNLFLIGGQANKSNSQIFSSTVTRDAQCHISGFGAASFFANSADPESIGGIDGGMAYETNTNVLFFTIFPQAYICELKPGSTVPDKNISLWTLPGYDATASLSTGSLTFVPPGFPGAGRLKIGNFASSGQFFDALITADGTGTYNISIQGSVDLGYNIEGMAYIKGGCSAYFPNNAILVCDFDKGNIFAYDIDASGNPIPASRRVFLSGVQDCEGLVVDNNTGDLLFSIFGNSNSVLRVDGVTCPKNIIASPLVPAQVTNTCPFTTADLTTIVASNTPAGATLTWHTATPATAANTFANPSAVTAGTYYASFTRTTNLCLGADVFLTTPVNVVVSGCNTTAPGGVTTNLKLWLKADAGTSTTTNNTTISSWINQGGTASNISATGSGQPLFYSGASSQALNFNPVVNFDGADDFFSTNSTFETDGAKLFTIFSIAQSRSIAAQFQYLLGANVINVPSMGFGISTAPASKTHLLAWNNTDLFGLANHVSYQPLLLGLNRSAATTVQMFNFGADDGGKQFIGNFFGSFFYANLDIGRFGGDNGTVFNGMIPEQIIYGASLSNTEMLRVNSYLALKYGITLDQTTATDYLASDGSTKMWTAATAAAGFNNDIFGIGTDAASGLFQRISASVNNDGGVLTIASNNDFSSSNADPSRTAVADKNFLTIANNNGANAWTAAGAPLNYKILGRQWQAQSTGNPGTVFLQFNVDNAAFDIPATSISGGNYFLIADVNNNGSLGDETPVALVNTGAGFWGTGYNFANGQLFTLAIQIPLPCAPGGVGANLQMWHKADDGILTPGTVTSWTNLSLANFYSSVNTTSGTVTLLSGTDSKAINFNPTVNLGPTAAMRSTNAVANPSAANSASIFFVTGQNDGLIYNVTNSSTAWTYSATTGGSFYNGGAVGAGSLFATPADGGIKLGAAVIQPSPALSVLSQNGKSTSVFAGAQAYNPGSVAAMTFGQYSNAGTPNVADRYFNEIIQYSSPLTAVQSQQVQSYLALKYGISLDQSTAQNYLASDGVTTMWSAANAKPGFNNAIFGIGSDAASCLYQRVSKSTDDDGGVLTISNNNNFTLANADAARTILADKSFLTIANNDGANAWTASGAPPNYKILERQWQAQSTGNPGTVFLQFNVDNAAFDLPPVVNAGSSYYLLADANNNGSLSDETPVALTNSGAGLWSAGYNFANGQLFTLATRITLDPCLTGDNNSFEQPALSGASIQMINKSSVTGWDITPDNVFEIWTNGNPYGVPAYDGNQFIEVDAYQFNTVYKTITAAAGKELTVSFAHRGRNGPDVMRVTISTSLAGPYTLLGTYNDGNGSWGYYSANYTIPATGTYYIRFEAISSTGSPAEGNFLDAVSFALSPLPAVFNIPSASFPTTYCMGDVAPALPSTSSDGFTGTWSPAAISTATAGTTSYIFTPDANQCANAATLVIMVNAKLTPLFTPVPSVCSGATPAALPTTSNNGITGVWAPALNSAATTTYTFTPDAGQCANTATMTIAVNPLPVYSDLSVNCTGAALNSVAVNATVSAGILEYNVDGGTYQASNTFTGLTTGLHTFNIRVQGTLCEVSSGAQNINCSCPVVSNNTISSDQPLCGNVVPAKLMGTDAVTTPAIAFTYQWQSSIDGTNWTDIQGETQKDLVFSAPLAKNVYFRRLVKLNGCPDAVSNKVSITINPLPAYTDLTVNCTGNSLNAVAINATISNGGALEYNMDGGAYQTSNTFNGLTTGLHNFNIRLQGSMCQVSSGLQNISCACPVVSNNNISTDQSICVGSVPAMLTGSVPVATPTVALSFQWQLSTDQINWNDIAGAIAQNFTGTALNQTTYYRRIIKIPGCADATSNTITITVSQNITPVFSFAVTYCQNATAVTLPAVSDNGIKGSWNPAVIATASTGKTNYLFTPDAGQCSISTESVMISVNITETPVFSFETNYCQNQLPFSLPATSDNGITGTWTPAVVAPTTGIGVYNFTPSAGQCSISTVRTTITVSGPPPPFSLGHDTSFCEGENIILKPNIDLTGNYRWQNGETNKSIVVKSTGVYSLSIDNGCGITTDAINIIAVNTCQLLMPNAFTPNGDGNNDVFKVKHPFPVKQFLLVVYNRWGQRIFYTNDIYSGWDGRYRNIMQLAGGYVWELNLIDNKNAKLALKGSVILIR